MRSIALEANTILTPCAAIYANNFIDTSVSKYGLSLCVCVIGVFSRQRRLYKLRLNGIEWHQNNTHLHVFVVLR